RLQVAMDYAHSVRKLEPVEQLTEPLGHPQRRHEAGFLELGAPGAAGDELHDEKRPAGADRPVVVDAGDVRVIDFGRGARFTLESPERGLIAEERSDHPFRRDLTLQPQVPCLEYGAEAAAAERAIEPVLPLQRPLDRHRQGHLGAVLFTTFGDAVVAASAR